MLFIKFTIAALQWIFSGFKLRNPWLVKHIYENKCKPCEKFVKSSSPDIGSCGACGCSLRREGIVLNKIAWKTESCPEKKW